GAGNADRHRRRRLLRWRSRSVAPLDGSLAQEGRAGTVPGQTRFRHAGAQLQPRIRRTDLPPDSRLRRIRFPGVPLRELCASGVRVLLAQVLRARGLYLRAAQQPADGLLLSFPARAGRAVSRRESATGGCDGERVGLHARAAEWLGYEFRGTRHESKRKPRTFTRSSALSPWP